MLATLDTSTLRQVGDWLNANEGVLALLLFAGSAAFAWFSGIITALQRRPRLRVKVIPGPTMYTVQAVGPMVQGYDTHRVSIAIYIQISNAGSAPTSIGDIHVGYKWSLIPLSPLWWQRSFQTHWITQQSVAIQDFQVALGESGDVKVYPFLTQKSSISGGSAKTYLEIGEMTNGVIYFEEADAFGACQPALREGGATMKLKVHDAFGGVHVSKIRVPYADIAEARKFNPSFGDTIETLRRPGASPSE